MGGFDQDDPRPDTRKIATKQDFALETLNVDLEEMNWLVAQHLHDGAQGHNGYAMLKTPKATRVVLIGNRLVERGKARFPEII